MNQITKVSDITASDVAEYLRLPEVTSGDLITINNLLGVSKAYISSYTGKSIEELDDCQDIVIVCFILCQDMWDNRTMYVDKGNISNVVDTILGMHSVNLLPKETA